ncbi:conjugal transfer protein TraC [Rhizobium sp. BK068]|uniref:conjugal transfer protein TraC n=1 Tax=Rhizobium sp. BK068 TaxID=2512130 RepID=UPI0010505743|nr:conjugal transfer protein TraC [Rhizobium sp. BK068]TCM76619.1 TraC-like protein [Rhizobium sp. BK068]
MKKPSSKIRDEIARLQEQLKAAETREAERIGRIALKAGLGEIEIEEAVLQAAFEDLLAKRFRGGQGVSNGGKKGNGEAGAGASTATVTHGAAQGDTGEA